MRKYLFCEAGFIEKPNWLPNCWVNVECPTPDDFDFLEKELNVPAAFLHDIADTDERPRIDSEGNWLFTIRPYLSGLLPITKSSFRSAIIRQQ